MPSNYMQSVPTTTRRVRAVYEYEEDADDRLPLFVGDVITLIDEADGWFEGYNESGRFGWFPQNYVGEYFFLACSHTMYKQTTRNELTSLQRPCGP